MNRRRLIVVCWLLLISSVGGYVHADDAETIRNSTEKFVAAFDKGDARAVAAIWTADGELIDAAGEVYSGRPAIEDAYAKFFAAHPGVKIEVSVDSVRLLSADAALEEGTATLKSSPTDVVSSGKYTAVHVKQDGQWLVAFVREFGAASAEAGNALEDLDWLVGKWTGEEHGATTEIVCRWMSNKSYLERTYSVTTPDKRTIAGVQLVGRNAHAGYLTSWNFNFDGSHAVATWVPLARGWAIRSIGLLPDGNETHAVNVLTKLDDNAYAWQSMQRSIGLETLPDTDEVILKRVVSPQPAKK